MDQPVLVAQIRRSKGKGAVRKLRNRHKIPAIFYGPGREPRMLAVDYPEMERLIRRKGRENTIVDLQIQTDEGSETTKAMVKELVIDPVLDTFLHVDFYEVSMDKEISVAVPIRLINTPVGVTNGGILQHVRRELAVSCLPDKLIDGVTVDVSGLEIGGASHIRDIDLPDGVRSTEDENLTVAIVAAPTVAPVEEEEEFEEAEAEEMEAESEAAEAERS